MLSTTSTGAESGIVFYDPGELVDHELQLELVQTTMGQPTVFHVPAYRFMMHVRGMLRPVGTIQLRLSHNWRIEQFYGHIGYEVYPAFRGRRYAARSCELLLHLARLHDLNPLWITCNPDNWASRRTCEHLGAQLIEIVDLPPDDDMYRIGERRKCRYRLFLGALDTTALQRPAQIPVTGGTPGW